MTRLLNSLVGAENRLVGSRWSHLLGLVQLVLEREMVSAWRRTSSHSLDLHPVSLPSKNITPPFIMILSVWLQGKLFLKDMLLLSHDHNLIQL